MRDLIQSQKYYLKKDSSSRMVSLILIIASIGLVLWLGLSTGGWDIKNIFEPLSIIVSSSVFLYFILPMHTCFFSTEGFETGSVKNVIASGVSRIDYILGKFICEFWFIVKKLFQFYGIFLIAWLLLLLFTGGEINNIRLRETASIAIPAILLNVIYLTSFSALVLMFGILSHKTANVTILTFIYIFGNLMIYGYWKDSGVFLLRKISDYSIMTQIMKFSGFYVVDGERILMTSVKDYLIAGAIPISLIIISITIAIIVFNKQDI